MPSDNAISNLTYEDCFHHVANEVFRFRPSDYQIRHPKWPGQVGLEIEMFAFDRASLESGSKPKLLPLFGSGKSIEALIGDWAAPNDSWKVESDSTGKLMRVLMEHGDQITFEPGGQIEFSSIPYPCLSDAILRMEAVQGSLRRLLAERGVVLLQTGINPWLTVDEIGLQMAKPRYRAMNAHFTAIGPMGQRMMRQTATVQVNLDFGDCDHVLAKRYLASNLMAPFATALFANSPQVNNVMSDKFASTRAEAWRHIDKDRTGIPKLDSIAKGLSKKECVQVYLDYLLDAGVVFIEALDYARPEKRMTFRYWLTDGYRGTRPTLQDFKTHMSLHFPEVRARGFLELRSIDCQARPWQGVPAAFYSALLYSEDGLEKALQLLQPEMDKLDELLVQASYGMAGVGIGSRAQQLMELALECFAKLPPCFQGEGTRKALNAFYNHFTEKQRCPADDLRDQARSGTGLLRGSDFEKVEERWFDLAN